MRLNGVQRHSVCLLLFTEREHLGRQRSKQHSSKYNFRNHSVSLKRYRHRFDVEDTQAVYIRARIEPNLKVKAEAIFDEFGVTPSQVITMLYKQVSSNHEIPLDLRLPNQETEKSINEARKGKDAVKCEDIDDLFNQLDI